MTKNVLILVTKFSLKFPLIKIKNLTVNNFVSKRHSLCRSVTWLTSPGLPEVKRSDQILKRG